MGLGDGIAYLSLFFTALRWAAAFRSSKVAERSEATARESLEAAKRSAGAAEAQVAETMRAHRRHWQAPGRLAIALLFSEAP